MWKGSQIFFTFLKNATQNKQQITHANARVISKTDKKLKQF